MSRRLLSVALALIALPIAGCASSEQAAAPAPAPAPSTQTQPAAVKSPDQAASDQRHADRRALRQWGRAAEKACRRLQKTERRWVDRINRDAIPTGARPTNRDFERVGQSLRGISRYAEREYQALSRIPLPEEEEALYKIFAFLDVQEESVVLIGRLGAEIEAHFDRDSAISGYRRLIKLLPRNKTAARAAGADACTK